MPVSEDLQWRGLVHQLTDPSLPKLLDHDHLVAYIGFDPTADSLHVGNLLQLLNLRRLQDAGHQPIALAGGGTGLIGDPSGKQSERSLLDEDTLAANLAAIRPQLERLLDFGGSAGRARAVLVDNADWLRPLHLTDFLRDIGKLFKVNEMVRKESVRSRLEERDQGISFTELSYMLLQAYDFLHLYDTHGCRLQMGGSDQWGNITEGIELIRRLREGSAYGLTTPLVVRADGSKYGKSVGDNIWLGAHRTSPYQFFQYWLRLDDADVGPSLRYFTLLGRERIEELDAEREARPQAREAQRVLAREVTTLVHGADEAARVEAAAAALFSEHVAALDEATLVEVLADAPSYDLARSSIEGGLELDQLLTRTGVAKSASAARTLVTQGGVYLNGRRAEGAVTTADLLHDRYLVVRTGKRNQHLLRFA